MKYSTSQIHLIVFGTLYLLVFSWTGIGQSTMTIMNSEMSSSQIHSKKPTLLKELTCLESLNLHDDIGGDKSNEEGQLFLKDTNGNIKAAIDSDLYRGALSLFDFKGNETIRLDANYYGDGRIMTDELIVKGGSDIAERFDVVKSETKAKPGMIVSIDSEKSGKLSISQKAFDRKVVGIISGANGADTGLRIGKSGDIADGRYPVALTGRVYVYANEEGGAIQAGDLLTTSSTVGQAMKASDYQKAQGAIIGKAMTGIDENGFVLVFVNLQ